MNHTSYGKTGLNTRFIFLVSTLGFLIGDILGVLQQSVWMTILLVGTAMIMAIMKKEVGIILFLLLFFSIGYNLGSYASGMRMNEYEYMRNITNDFEKQVSVTGEIKKELYKRDRSRVFLYKIDNFDNFDKNSTNPFPDGNKYVEVQENGKKYGSIFLEIPSNLSIAVGDRLRVKGKIRNNVTFPLEGFSRYAFLHGGFGYLFAPGFEILSPQSSTALSTVREYWQEKFEKGFPRDEAGILLGMTIGSFELISDDLKNTFLASGTSHILVVSGSNIAFLILFLSFFLKFIPLSKISRILIIGSSIIFYMLLVGVEISVVRASIMGILSYLAIEGEEKIFPRASLALALIISIIIEPLGPLYDAGFGLSFCATLGILVFQKSIMNLCKHLGIPHILSAILTVTLGASLGSIPMLLFHFSQIIPLSILSNILIAGFLGWILTTSIIYIIIGILGKWILYIFGYIVYFPTKIVIEISRLFDGGHAIIFERGTAIILALFILGYYSILFIESTEVRTNY